MESRDQRRKHGCWRIGCLSGVLLAVVVWAVFYFPHDWNLLRLSRQYSHIAHPAGTQVMRRWSEVGNLIGNGNHIDYFVGEMRSYTSSREAIRRFYRGKTIWNPVAKQRWHVELFFVDELKSDDMTLLNTPYPAEVMATHLGRHQGLRHRLYIVYVFDYGHDWGLDMRGS